MGTMTTPYNPRTAINELHDMIDKHVPVAEARLQEHYQKAAQTRAMLQKMGCWPAPSRNPRPPRKKHRQSPKSAIAKLAYEWAIANGKTTNEAAEQFFVSPDSIHSYRQYRKLPKLKR
jgi:hypothetical protein